MRDPDTNFRNDQIPRLRRRVTDIAFRVSDSELAHAVLDLSRTARRELSDCGFADHFTFNPPSGHREILLQNIMPEIARRLNAGSDATLMLTHEEGRSGPMSGVKGQELRRLVGSCWERSGFDHVGQEIREILGSRFASGDKIFATEVLGTDPREGNLLEIALGRCVAPDANLMARWADPFAERIVSAGHDMGLDLDRMTWSPDLCTGVRSDSDAKKDPDLDIV